MQNKNITNIEFARLVAAIGGFEQNPTFAVAVSGGADSMALLLMANDWAAKCGGKVVALTVNHNLREEAAEEVRQVANWCAALGVQHATLNWQHSGEVKRVQEAARNARYKLLTDYCKANTILHLLTAHHAGDQVETMFFRLARGSGLMGLSAMSAQTMVSGVRLLRPLLNIPKSRLVATLKAKNQAWIEDPSNQNMLYSRVKIRAEIAKIPKQNEFFNRSLKVINSIGKYRNLLENKIASQLTDMVDCFPEGYAIVKNHKDLSVELLAAILQAINGEEHPPRSENLQRLLHWLQTSGYMIRQNTLAGLIIKQLEYGKVIVYREAKAIQPEIRLEKNIPQIWDKRFLVESDTALTVRALTSLRNLRDKSCLRDKKTPKAIIKTLPSFWHLEELVCVPHIGYMNEKYAENPPKVLAKFYPAKPLAGASFFVMNDINNQ